MRINADKVAEVIILARDLNRDQAELHGFLQGLNSDEQTALVALFWVGRGSFDADEFDEAVALAAAEASTPVEDYLTGSPHLADHLESGLEAMGIDSSAVEDALH